MKKLFFFGLIVVPVAATAILWVLINDGISCLKDSSEVTVTVKKITLREASRTSINVIVNIHLINDSNEGTTLEKIEYDIYLGYQDKWYWLGRGEKDVLEISAKESVDFTVTTIIDNKQLVDVAGSYLGADASEMRVDGRAWFKVGTDSVEVEFEKKDIDPYKPFLEDDSSTTETVESGTEGSTSE